jgi:hypothetical protein
MSPSTQCDLKFLRKENRPKFPVNDWVHITLFLITSATNNKKVVEVVLTTT